MKIGKLAEQLESLAALDDPVRRRLYLFVCGQDAEVGRDDAARATGVSRALAAFHLDKLAAAGLLETTFRRRTARTGPGAGRPAKLYRRAPTAFDVSLPPRRYEIAAHVLAQALAEGTAEGNLAALRNAAQEWGDRLAHDPSMGSRRGLPLTRAARALQACGFEPRRTPEGEIVLRNCPFDSLRSEHRDLICGMNLALIQGLLAGLELKDVNAILAPREGMCCVALSGRPEGPA
jgi:predicted ArsR family transcriptional regulator